MSVPGYDGDGKAGTDIVAPGDYDGDGKSDLVVFRPSTGVWWINHSNLGFTTFSTLTWGVSSDIPVLRFTTPRTKGDLNLDGKADVIFRNKSTGQNIGWLMNGLVVSVSAFLDTEAETNWEIVGPR